MDDIIFEAVRHCDTDPISLTDSNIAHMDSFDFNSQQSPPRYSSSSEMRSTSSDPSQTELTPSPATFEAAGDQQAVSPFSDSTSSGTISEQPPRRRGRASAETNRSNSMRPLSRPCASDACTTIVAYLMQFNKSSDEEFSRKAIESLTKKLKDKRDELDALIACCGSEGKEAEKCVTISANARRSVTGGWS